MYKPLIDKMPERYKISPEVVDFQAALDKIMSFTEEQRNDFLLQLNLSTATWGLCLWERLYGIPVDATMDYDSRRSRVMAKMRGSGTTTTEFLKNITESFVKGNANIVEFNSEYRFEVQMVNRIGIPPNFDNLKAAINEAKPAHLAVAYILLYNTHGMFKDARITHGELAAYTHRQIREEEILGISKEL